MAKKSQNKQNPVVSSIIAIIVVIIGGLIYAFTGVDLLGTNSSSNTTNPVVVTRVASGGTTANVQNLNVGIGYGFDGGSFWQVYFTAPGNSPKDSSQWKNGVDVPISNAIDQIQKTLDIAAFEMNNEAITAAILRAKKRGVTVRIVTDNENGIGADDTTLKELQAAGIPIVDDGRSALMHNKFMIMDSISVWTGSLNYTMNGVYRNNNNTIMMRSRRAVQLYQAEFDEMFVRKQFGPTSDPSNTGTFTQDGVPIEVYFASENDTVTPILREINSAKNNIRFMSFSFTRDDMGNAMMAQAKAGVDVQGVFETTGSETRFSEFPRMFCAGLDVRQDGNPGILHHKVIIIDGTDVIIGSFNFSNNAVESNDENLVIIHDPTIASLYLDEFSRVQSIATVPSKSEINC